tara:strand:- start:971 stop:1126 length:156 start_codon:yes stop_codon:yes gene_type:complete
MNSTLPKSLWKVSTVFFNGKPGKIVKWTKTKFFVKFKTKSAWVNKSFIVWV